jgi:putative hydrolase of the HAD superfamily
MSADAVPELLNGTTALILDMCGTFIFGHDRFDPDQAYGETYRLLGGATLSNQNVYCAIDACFSRMNATYLDAARHNSFPSVRSTLRVLPETIRCSESELSLLEEVFAKHEVGRVPEDYAEMLQFLAKRYRLALALQLHFVRTSESIGYHDSGGHGWPVHRWRRPWSCGRRRCGK